MVWFLTLDHQHDHKRTWAGTSSVSHTGRNRKQKLSYKLTDSGFEDELFLTPSPSSERAEVLLWSMPTETHSVQLSWYRQYGDTGYKIQKEKEKFFHPCKSLARQPQLNADARCKLVSWLIPVHKYLSLSFECCCLTINIMDRFLTNTPVAADCFQLLGVTALLLASKQVEVYSPRISHLLSLCCDTFTKEQLCNLECLILVRLDFQLSTPTLAFFLDCYTNLKTILLSERAALEYKLDKIKMNQCSKLAQKLCELSLADYAFNKYPPSLTARCALQLAGELQQVALEPLHSQDNQWDSSMLIDVSDCARDSTDSSSSNLSENLEKRQPGEYSLILECTNNLRLLASLNQEALTML